MFYEKLSRRNAGYRYILTIMEIYSRKGFAIPLKKIMMQRTKLKILSKVPN